MDTRTADQVLLATARLVTGISVRAADQVGDLTPVQLRALTVVRQLGPLNLVQLTEALGVTVSTTSRLVDRLVAADLVDRRPSEVTRREISLTLTAHGADVLRSYDRLRVQALRERLHRLPPEDQQTVLDALALLTDERAAG
ncbi:MarR family transcriptional regulator [Modestobacter sp. NPDC049651]|uniref:MarR family winged helix-turn-helix transcriptional regulator n=1 Tax=unclassified Modestobacter TaxID=2643866 RepID=UPI0033C10ED5